MLKKIICFIFALCMFLIPIDTLAASGNSYTYNSQNEAVPVPQPYSVNKTINLEYGLKEPMDMRINGEYIYILDSGNERVVVVDKSYSLVKEIYIMKDGKPFKSDELTGLWVDGETILLADRRGEAIYRIDMNGELLRIYNAPENIISETSNVFMPKRILTDKTGLIYILLENEHRGMMVMNPEGEFVTYYGSVQVNITASLLSDLLWRNFMTEEQIQGTAKYVPGTYNDFTTDGSGFIYAVKGLSSNTNGLICKLNPEGNNVLPYKGHFGNFGTINGKSTSFNSIAVDKKGFIAAVDSITNRVFEYSPDGELLYVFGDSGQTKGCFVSPSAMIYNDNDLLVLDSQTGSVTVLKRESFADNIHEAVTLYRNAEFKDAGKYWDEVLRFDNSYELALIGLGKIEESNKNYPKAMEYYKSGNSKADYSSAFYKYRTALAKKYFSVAMVILITALIGLFIYKKFFKKPQNSDKPTLEHRGKTAYAFYTLLHPFDGFGELCYNQKGSTAIASIISLCWFFVTCLCFNYNGFIFNNDNPEDFNVLIVFGSTIGIVVLFTFCIWLLSTFFEGKGTLKQLWIGVCYSLIPMIIGLLAELVLTNVLSLKESFFVALIRVVFAGYTLFLVFVATARINQHGFIKNLISVFCTFLGMLAIVFLVVLFFNLIVQFVDFGRSVFDEISYRILAK